MPIKVNPYQMIVPFIYFYMLSFGVIFVAAYWLITTPGNVNSTYARTLGTTNHEIKIKLSKEENRLFNLEDLTTCEYQNSTKKINKFFSSRKAPLAGEGCSFVNHAEENGLNHYLVPAIAWCESNGGKVIPHFGGEKSFNAWGWAVYDSNDLTRNVNGYGCESWEECIGRVSRGIARNSQERSLGLNPEEIVTWYTPASVAKGGGDPLQAPWTKCVKQMMNLIEKTKL